MPLIGEFNVRNAAMAIAAARFYGVPLEKIRAALWSFKGIARRQEVRGEGRGSQGDRRFRASSDGDRETLTALRQRYPEARLWAIFEPRSNTTRRAVLQNELASVQSGGRRLHLADRAAGANSERGTAESGSGRGGVPRFRAAGVLREGCGAHCRTDLPFFAGG